MKIQIFPKKKGIFYLQKHIFYTNERIFAQFPNKIKKY